MTATHDTPPTLTPRRPGLVEATWTIMLRELRPVLHDPFSVTFNLVQPLTFLLLFGPLLAGTVGVPLAESLTWFVPGVLGMIVLFGVGMTGSNLQFEIHAGSHERTLVTPVPRSALLVGRALKEFAPVLAQSAVLLVVAVLLGYRADVVGTLLGLVLLGLFAVGLASLSYALGVATASTEWMFWAIQQTMIFPLLLLSGMLLPLEDGPRWMQGAAAVNPLTHLIDAERALAAGDLLSRDVATGVVATVLTLVVGLGIGLRAMRA
ncbi:ABC transporter permease [Georgenia sp. Z1344]|uniref:ABC transporter permease n=1 Tax=Georgenia sp. Z1344 TaxID=3416706 RepID=UPI003CF58410